jgi:hypothetical protein
MASIAIGRLLRANTAGCVIGCQVSQSEAPAFGQMVRIPLKDGSQVYGLVNEIHIDDDGLVRQLVTSAEISEEIIEDNRKNRNMPVEMSVSFIGWEKDHVLSQTRVPRPPLSLDKIFVCTDAEVAAFTSNGKFSYLRALLRDEELPSADLVTAHLRQVLGAHKKLMTGKDAENALREVIALLKDDYPQLMDVLSAVSEVLE